MIGHPLSDSRECPYRVYEPAELGRDGYPPIWHEQLKHEVRDAAGHRCIRCGHPYRRGEHGSGEWSRCDQFCKHTGPLRGIDLDGPGIFEPLTPPEITAGEWARGAHIEARYRILTVHHLDGNKANCRWWNLVALCQRCHLEIQGRVVMDRVWPHEHSDWFKPYVAGYYAWRYLGEAISRQEAEQRKDELLGLEVRQLALGAT